MIAFVGFGASEDFCQAFKRHDNTISYVYKQTLRTKVLPMARIESHHIIIDGKYWNLEFDTKLHTISFDRYESHSAPLFTDQNIGAACLWKGSKEEGECLTYIFRKNDTHKSIDETSIWNNTFDRVRDLNEFSKPVTRQVLNLRSDNYAFVNSVNKDNWTNEVEFAVGSGKRFKRLVFRVVAQSFTEFTFFIVFSDITEKPNNDFYFDHNRDIIGISNQYSAQKNDLGYLVLTKEGDQVYWCWQWRNDTNVS